MRFLWPCGDVASSDIFDSIAIFYNIKRRYGSSDQMGHIRDNPSKDFYEDGFFSIRYSQKGTAHITCKRYDLTEKKNDIVVKHYPGMLAAR